MGVWCWISAYGDGVGASFDLVINGRAVIGAILYDDGIS